MSATLVAECWTHGRKTYRYNPKTDRFCCPVEGCESFISAEIVDRLRGNQ